MVVEDNTQLSQTVSNLSSESQDKDSTCLQQRNSQNDSLQHPEVPCQRDSVNNYSPNNLSSEMKTFVDMSAFLNFPQDGIFPDFLKEGRSHGLPFDIAFKTVKELQTHLQELKRSNGGKNDNGLLELIPQHNSLSEERTRQKVNEVSKSESQSSHLDFESPSLKAQYRNQISSDDEKFIRESLGGTDWWTPEGQEALRRYSQSILLPPNSNNNEVKINNIDAGIINKNNKNNKNNDENVQETSSSTGLGHLVSVTPDVEVVFLQPHSPEVEKVKTEWEKQLLQNEKEKLKGKNAIDCLNEVDEISASEDIKETTQAIRHIYETVNRGSSDQESNIKNK